MSLLFMNVHTYPLKENIDLTVITFSTYYFKMKGCLLFPNVSGIFILKDENTHLSMNTFVNIVFRKTLCLFGEH